MTKDEIQAAGIAAAIPHKRAGVVAGTGVGKTLLGLKHMRQLHTEGDEYLVVAPKKAIFKEWIDHAEKFGFSDLLPYIKFSTYRSLPKQSKHYRRTYLDECHSLLVSHAPWLRSYQGEVLGLTGTRPVLEYTDRFKLMNEFCPVVYAYETEEAVDDEILNDYHIFVHMLDLDSVNKNIEVKTKTGSFFVTEKDNYNYWSSCVEFAKTPKNKQMASIMRMKAMQGFKSKEALTLKIAAGITDKLIIFANTMDQADRMCRNSCHSGNPLADENLDLFKKGAIMRMSTVLQLIEGSNIPNLLYSIIMHAYGNERKAAQRIGRSLRLPVGMIATVHILCYRDTVDVKWVQDALQKFNQNKITVI